MPWTKQCHSSLTQIGLTMNKKSALALLSMSLLVGTAYADDTGVWPNVKISGFGTGALTMSNSDDAEFARPNQASGVKHDARTGVDSNIGLQADVTFNPTFSLTGQGLVRKDAQDDFGAELSLAFVKAKLTDDLSIRLGRIFVPAFMFPNTAMSAMPIPCCGHQSSYIRKSSSIISMGPTSITGSR